jgi:t-SNARE complex subunit (syntaxin)
MLEFIKKEGYLDKLKFNGLNYNMKNSNMHLDNMIKKARGAKNDSWISESYVDYDMDWDERSAEYSRIRKEFAAANPDMSNDDVYKAIEAQIPPRTLKVIFKLEGGVIVPDEVKFGT